MELSTLRGSRQEGKRRLFKVLAVGRDYWVGMRRLFE